MATTTHDDVQQVTVRMPKDLYLAIKTLAFATDEPINDHLIRAVADYLGSSGHDQTVDAFLEKAQTTYHGVLEKLAAT